MQFRIFYLTMSMATYPVSVHGQTKSGTGINTGGQAHFISLTHLIRPALTSIQVTNFKFFFLFSSSKR